MDEDMILPDDYAEPAPQDSETTVETQSELGDGIDTEPAGEDTKPPVEDVKTDPDPTPQPQTVKIKFNKEERELPLEEAAALAQKGMNYERAIERARQEAAQQARDSVIADMGMVWNGKPITTESEYKQALQEQELIEKYKDRELPPEVIQELVESRRDREARKAEREENEKKSKEQAEYNEFFQLFKDLNDRPFDPNKDTVPQEVWEANYKGMPLKYAYLEHYNKELRNQLKIAKQNETNIKKAPVGSVTAGGGNKAEPEDLFLKGFNSI